MVCGAIKIYEIYCGNVDGRVFTGVCLDHYYQTNHLLTLSSLGDRHGENILFEEGTGGILHVDFNCLFDKVRMILSVCKCIF